MRSLREHRQKHGNQSAASHDVFLARSRCRCHSPPVLPGGPAQSAVAGSPLHAVPTALLLSIRQVVMVFVHRRDGLGVRVHPVRGQKVATFSMKMALSARPRRSVMSSVHRTGATAVLLMAG